ncbi:MAG: TRAP transporter small permease subunit [Atribacterota bacterium]|nr:TRAP transporter small permease subunit [Atribacterota bacterium]MDD4896626.1 TRAP transporter small permease subunit [Atribacterota bacterium]MDD5636655.1 TRAP transporter small permease subunit [Atribacterota bacterium]
MKFLSKLLNLIDQFSIMMGKICKYLILAILGVMLYEIISRYVFNSPTDWASELSSYMFGTLFFLGGAYSLIKEEHVRMDLLYIKWPRKVQKIADIATFPLLALYLGLFIQGGIGNTLFSIRNSEVSRSLWAPPLAPIKIIITFGAFLLLMEAISILIRDILVLFNKELPGVINSSSKKNKEVKL